MVVAALVSPTSSATTHLLVQLAVLLGGAHLMGALAKRVGQPVVIGYVAAGVLLGPSVLGHLSRGLSGQLLPTNAVSGGMLLGIASLGSVFLLALTGLEIHPPTIRKWSRQLPWVALGSLVPALALGYGLGWVLPSSFVGLHTTRGGFALLMAIAFGISSPPVMSAVLRGLGLERREFAHVAMSIAMTDDVTGWVLLGIVVAGAGGAAAALAKAGIGLVLLAVAAWSARFALIRWGSRIPRDSRPLLGIGFVAAMAAISNGFGIEAVLGAFVAGLALRRMGREGAEVAAALRPIVTAFLGPVFFAVAGLRVDVGSLAKPVVLTWTVVVVALAVFTKVIGVGIPARLSGRSPAEALALGAILNVRGSLEVVLAGVGLGAGILTTTSYSVVVIVALATSAVASPLLRYALRADRSGALATDAVDAAEAGVERSTVGPEPA